MSYEQVMRGISRALPEIALKLNNDAKELCPKETGYLADSIKIISVTDNNIVIGTNCEYASFIELGTGAMIAAHGEHDMKQPVTDWAAKRKRGSSDPTTMPFLSRAAYINLRWIADTLARYIKHEFKG